MPIGILKLVPALSDLLTASMPANSLSFLPLTVTGVVLTGNSDRFANFNPLPTIWINTVEQFNGDDHEAC
jgi:hypothetical protein